MKQSEKDAQLAKLKAEYEVEKEKELQRRLAILSGNVNPVQTTVHLQQGEHAYAQFQTERLVSIDYVESRTIGKAKKKGVLKRAIVGDVLGGGVGAVIGGVTAGSEVQSETTQQRVSRTETIDSGTMLFTNKRMLFIGKEIVEIPYINILTVIFTPGIMEVKYPSMVKGESYTTVKFPDAKIYYTGIRLRGKGKEKLSVADVPMDDYPEFEMPVNAMAASTTLGYIVSLFFIFYGVGTLPKGALQVLMGLVFFPPLWNFFKDKWNISINGWIKAGIFVVLLFIAGIVNASR